MSFFLLLNIEDILYRDAPKWKFLAEAKQNETLGRRLNNASCSHVFYHYINSIDKIYFLLFFPVLQLKKLLQNNLKIFT